MDRSRPTWSNGRLPTLLVGSFLTGLPMKAPLGGSVEDRPIEAEAFRLILRRAQHDGPRRLQEGHHLKSANHDAS